MIRWIIITGFLFTIGNVVWIYFGDPKLFYVPLAVFLFLLLYNCLKPVTKITKAQEVFLSYFILLAGGNIVKQLFYTDKIKQINDYVWGGIVTAWLIYKLWSIQRQQSGRK